MLPKSSSLFTLILFLLCITTVYTLSLSKFIRPEVLEELRSSKNMNLFTKYLGIKNKGLCEPDTDENMDPMFNEELSFGDLLIDEDAEDGKKDDANDVENDFASGASPSKEKRKKSGKKPNKWEDGVVPYYISKDFTSRQKQKIENAIEDMNSKLSSVYFRPYRNFDRNYVMIFSGKGCYSKLGMKGGQQPVSLQSNKCLEKGTIQHEMLHVLGFPHEQNRPDRDNYIKILYQNIPKKWHKNYKRYRPSEAVFIGTYDYYSVLQYPPQAPKSHGKKLAFKVLDDSVDREKIGERKKLSEIDIQRAEELYNDDEEL